jgi:UDP-glucose 4-epimerase
MAHALVTGAAGFIGSTLTDRLLGDGVRVTGVDAFTDYYDVSLKRRNLSGALAHKSFELLELDLGTADLARLPEVDVVFHNAAQPGVRASWGREFSAYTHHNVLSTQRLLERFKQSKLERFVYASSSSVYGDAESYPTSESMLPRPFSPYGVTKLAGEHLALLYGRNFGTPVAALRYFTVYGPTWRSTASAARCSRASRSRCTATATSRATSRSWPTRWRRTCARGSAPRRRACTTWAAAPRSRCWRPSRCSRRAWDGRLA